MIKVLVDSACDLPAELYKEHDIRVVPINIQFGSESYRDGVDIDRTMFYAKIEELGILPSTSQPSAGQFEEQYVRLAEEGATDVISLHLTAKLSGTFQSAQMAKELVAKRVRVHAFDSACASAGLGFMAVEAARMAKEGRRVEEILARMKEIRPRVQIMFTLKDLRFAQMSGRVGRLQSSLSSLLSIKPIIVLENGLIDVAEKVRTEGKAVERILQMMVERVGTDVPVNLAAIHADVPEKGQALLDRARGLFNCSRGPGSSFVCNLTTTLLVHFGPGTLCLVAYRV